MYVDVARILPIPEGGEEACSCQRQCRNRKVCQAVVPLRPVQTDTHVTSMMDTKMSSITLLVYELKDGDYERPSVPHQNKLLGLRAPAFNWIDRCEWLYHPPPRCPILSSQRLSVTEHLLGAELVSWLFLNTHLSLTAYWVSISLNVQNVHTSVYLRVCVSASPTGLRLQSDMPVMFASLPHPEGVFVHQAAGVTEGVGAWQRGADSGGS